MTEQVATSRRPTHIFEQQTHLRSREPAACELDHLSAQPRFATLSVYYLQTDGLFGIEPMKQFIALFVAAIALVVLPTIAAADCPKGYVPCGERSQLCCPGK
jgi:hypothetical protein